MVNNSKSNCSQVNQPIKACISLVIVIWLIFPFPQQQDGTWRRINSTLLLQLAWIWRWKEIQKVLYKSLAWRTVLTFLRTHIADKHASSGKSFWIGQINKLPFFSRQIWKSAVLWQSLIDVWTTLVLFSEQSINQSSIHFTFDLWLRKKSDAERNWKISVIYFFSQEEFSKIQPNLFYCVQGRFLSTVNQSKPKIVLGSLTIDAESSLRKRSL